MKVGEELFRKAFDIHLNIRVVLCCDFVRSLSHRPSYPVTVGRQMT